MYVYCIIEARSCNHRYSGTAVSITYFECVFVAFSIDPAISVRHIVICGLSG
jgi:hypothetical protein